MGNEQFKAQHPLRSENLITKIHCMKEIDVIKHIEEDKLNINSPINNMGDTIFHYAAYNSLYEVMRHLLRKGASVEIANTRGLTPLDVALPEVRQWLYQELNKKR